MNSEPLLSPEVVQLGRAIRFAFVSFVVGLSYFAIRTTWFIRAAWTAQGFAHVFHDMLNGKPLPAITVFVLKVYPLLLICSVLVPVLAAGTLFSRRLVASFYLLGGLWVLALIQFLVMYQGLSAPFFEIIQAMQGG